MIPALPTWRLVHAGAPGELFSDCDAVVFGHSHIPLHETAADGFQICNPGSPTVRRRQPQHTMGIALVAEGFVSFDLDCA